MPADLLQTPLHAFHAALGAKFTSFAGYEMPLQYAAGVLQEHLHTRRAAGLFDVSHMGQVVLRAKNGDVAIAAAALERLVPVDVLGLPPGRQRYALFTNEEGGVLDDLMIAHRGDHLLLIVNAACKNADFAHLRTHLSADCALEMLSDRALIALQGPRAEAALGAYAPEVAEMRFMDARGVSVLGADCIVTRSGYTGEDGYEISVPAAQASVLAQALANHEDVQPIGLGARDSLRLEAGLCLYGSDLDTRTTPVEAALEWALSKARRANGARAGGYPGADIVLAQLASGAARRRIGLSPEGRAPVRSGALLFATEDSPDAIGVVTSGGFGPSVGAPISMGYAPTSLSAPGARIFAEVRSKRLPVTVARPPFVTQNYKRR